MTEEIEDALYSAAGVTARSPSAKHQRFHVANHPRASGTMQGPQIKVADFKAKLRAFLSEVDGTLTVRDLLDELE